MNTGNVRSDQLEGAFERLVLRVQQLERLANSLGNAQQQSGGTPNGGGGPVFSMDGVVISAGSNVTGATVNALVGGSTVAVSTNATVYNQMQAATVVTKTIMLGQNPDGTFSAISQSC